MAVTQFYSYGESDVSSFTKTLMGLATLRESKKVRKIEEETLSMKIEAFEMQKKEWVADASIREQKRVLEALSMTLSTEQYSTAKNKLKEIEGLKKTHPDLYRDFLTSGLVTKQITSQLRSASAEANAARQETQLLRTHIATIDATRRSIESEINAIYSADNLPSDLKIGFGREMKESLTALSVDRFDPSTMRPPVDIRIDMREAIETERARVLEEQIGKEERTFEARAEAARETASLKYEIDKNNYEFGSLQEVETARENRQAPPEVRQVYYDAPGTGLAWARKDKSGKRVPKGPYQKGGYKWMTESRAEELGMHAEWLAAGGEDGSIDSVLESAIRGE